MAVRIITDSAADLSRDMIRERSVEVMPIKISFGSEELRDGVDISTEEFYDRMSTEAELPKTSQINPFEYREKYRQVIETGDTAVVITISSKLSGGCQSAMTAAAEFPEQIFVVDSLNATVGQLVMVELACRLRDRGMDAEQIACALEEKKGSICVLAMLDTLENLKKGGRISPAAATVGSLLNVKPLAALRDGEIVVLGKARGARMGYVKLNEFIAQEGVIDYDMPLCFGYTGNSAEMLISYQKTNGELFEGRVYDIPVAQIGSAIGTHVGTGTIIIAYFRR
ncbi:MAG: DegV family protein [Lachnospiraceae bacterium]|nr:DegV family protein [Lachnospiraceae bacterium]